MEAGYIIKWGKLVPGREDRAFELFDEVIGFWRECEQKGLITSFEPYLFASGDREIDLGFILVRGPEEKLRDIVFGDEFKLLVTRGVYLIEHLVTEWLLAGEEVMAQVGRSAKIADEYALVH